MFDGCPFMPTEREYEGLYSINTPSPPTYCDTLEGYQQTPGSWKGTGALRKIQ